MAEKELPVTAIVDPSQRAEVEGPDDIKVGQWYWVNPDDAKDKWFGCVTHVGSNFVRVTGPSGWVRILLEDFDDECRFEPDPDGVIGSRIASSQADVVRLLERVKEVTASLAIAPGPVIGGSSETQALAVRGRDQPDMKSYGTALEKAKKETIPELFRQVERANEEMARWMQAKIIPLKAQAKGMNSVIERIQDRIFSVELYAGLTEEVALVRDGEPAPLTEKIHLFQRRHYMDEECLARYQTGGMTFRNIGDFDAWIAKDENMFRLLPFPRSMVAFRVRRKDKEREIVNLIDIMRFIQEMDDDKSTFLYMRNGGQLFRMSTRVDFDSKLFPDLDHSQLSGKIWAEMFCDGIKGLITDHDLKVRRAKYSREMKEYKARERAYEASLKTPEAKAKAKKKGLKFGPDRTCTDVPWPGCEPHKEFYTYEPHDRSSVYYDDITKHIGEEIKKHNRIALILQGLLDRSAVFHPHPPWQIWTPAGFAQALDLVYDDSRALPSGPPPDFEAFRARLNSSIKPGTVTIGQQRAWLLHEGKKESDRRDRDYRHRGENYRPTTHQPYGNPGPGDLARVESCPKSGRCTFSWTRELQSRHRSGEESRVSFTCGSSRLLNADAYEPGDFRQFFEDPRTRVDYLKWAPLLLEAEEYKAGNRKVSSPVPPPTKPAPTEEGRERYRRKKNDDSAEEEDDDLEAEEDAEEDAEGTIEDHEDCMDDEPLPDDDD